MADGEARCTRAVDFMSDVVPKCLLIVGILTDGENRCRREVNITADGRIKLLRVFESFPLYRTKYQSAVGITSGD